MKNTKAKKTLASFELALLIVSFFAFAHLISLSTPVIAQSTSSSPSVCCEKTKEGAFCINTAQENCAEDARSTPTSCETTSFCKLGTCYDSDEGICLENTPQNVCTNDGGTWDSREVAEIPQCGLGCCIIGDQAAFVPLVRCKKLSSFYGVENNYRTDITSEVACIAAAQAQDKGACIYEKDFERICEFTTRKDCGADEEVEVNGTRIDVSKGRKFYKDFLCSAEELNTACAKQTTTTCKDGKVYWVDSCGNLENVYSANKDTSWNSGRVAKPEEVCRANDGSDITCGNCDYLLGTRCSEYENLLGRIADTDFYCKRTECVDRDDKMRINGESWCVYDKESGDGLDPVGSRHYREVCVDGQVEVEPCADFRNEICLQGSIQTDKGDFSVAGCRINRWQECTSQTDAEECIDIDQRDCMYLPKITGLLDFSSEAISKGLSFENPLGGLSFTNPTSSTADREDDERIAGRINEDEGICVPNIPPGLKFWESKSAKGICGQANVQCTVQFEKGLLDGSKKVKSNGECLSDEWAMKANRLCTSLGDCGGYININDEFTDDGYSWKEDGNKKKFTQNTKNKIGRGYVGLVILAIFGEEMMPFVSGQNTPAENTWLSTNSYTLEPGSSLAGGTTYTGGTFVGSKGPITLSGTKTATLSADSKTLKIFDKPGGKVLKKHSSDTAFKAGKNVQGQGGGPGSHLSEFFEAGGGSPMDSLLSGVQYAAVAYGIGQLLGPLFGFDKKNTQALSTALAAGAGIGKFFAVASQQGGFLSNLFGAGNAALGGTIVGVGVAVVVFIAMYKDVSTKTITFECKPWQAPKGGDDCEVCNDEDLPCSEYRCKSLGQTCDIVNKGTEQEKCVNINPNDIEPPTISPDEEVLTKGHKYTDVKNSPPGPGFRIINPDASDGCLKAYTPLTFGIKTNEQAQCRIDFRHTEKFEDMVNFMGASNLFSTEHKEVFSLPGAKVLKNSSLVLENGKDFTFFIRCKDQPGNENEAEYAVRLCMDDSPDTTPPKIEATSIQNNGCVAEDQTNANVEFYTNEPSDCRWSTRDQSYDNMNEKMSCSSAFYQVNSQQLFTCKANLTGISRDGSDFFIRCKDQPGAPENDRNINEESFKFNLQGSTSLKMKNLLPNGTIFGGTSPAPVTIHAETIFGCNNGQSICFYSRTDNEKDFIQFANTNSEDGHSNQRQDLTAGDYDYRIKCVDGGGNVARDNIKFTLEIDENAPVVARAYEEDNQLKIVTVRDSECSYSFDDCDFSFNEGTEMPYANSTVHVAEWKKDKTYHIKCRDEFRNEEADCSIIVKPSEILY